MTATPPALLAQAFQPSAVGRVPLYCSAKCRQRAYRDRQSWSLPGIIERERAMKERRTERDERLAAEIETLERQFDLDLVRPRRPPQP